MVIAHSYFYSYLFCRFRTFVGIQTETLNYKLEKDLLLCLCQFCAQLSSRNGVVFCGVYLGARIAFQIAAILADQQLPISCITFGMPILQSDGMRARPSFCSFYDS